MESVGEKLQLKKHSNEKLVVFLLLVLIVICLAPLALGGCSGVSTPVGDDKPPSTTPGVEYQMAEVKTSTPTPTEVPPTVPKPTATFVPLVTPSLTADQGTPTRADVLRVGVAEARALTDAGEALLVDVRTKATYEQKHIAGASSMPADELAQRHAELPTDKLLIFYCA